MVHSGFHHKAPQSPLLDGTILHSNLWCGQSTTSLFCQASLPRCAST